jgi:hypothetical protein
MTTLMIQAQGLGECISHRLLHAHRSLIRRSVDLEILPRAAQYPAEQCPTSLSVLDPRVGIRMTIGRETPRMHEAQFQDELTADPEIGLLPQEFAEQVQCVVETGLRRMDLGVAHAPHALSLFHAPFFFLERSCSLARSRRTNQRSTSATRQATRRPEYRLEPACFLPVANTMGCGNGSTFRFIHSANVFRLGTMRLEMRSVAINRVRLSDWLMRYHLQMHRFFASPITNKTVRKFASGLCHFGNKIFKLRPPACVVCNDDNPQPEVAWPELQRS